MKIDAGQKNMNIIILLSKEKYQKTSLGKWGRPDISSNAKKQYIYIYIQEVGAGMGCKGRV